MSRYKVSESILNEMDLADQMFPEHIDFVQKLFKKREKEIQDLQNIKPDKVADQFKQYDAKVKKIMTKLGYEEDKEMQQQIEEPGKGQQIP